MADASGAPRRYKAFFSYSHANRAAGVKLFQKIDGYRVPKALHGRETPLGPAPAKLYPCFRDRDEEATSHDIKGAVKLALENSDQLVVLCSPRAAASKWIDYEIATFKALGKADRIHAVLIEGEPETSIPAALKSADGDIPLAADLRREGDGWHDGPLKLAAGLIGIGFGELKDREVARARAAARLNRIIAASFAVLFLGACSATWIALDRNEKMQDALVTVLRQVTERLDAVYERQGVSMTTREVERELTFAKGLVDTAFALAPDATPLLREQARLELIYAHHYRELGKSVRSAEAAAKSAAIYGRLGERGLPGAEMRTERGAALINEGVAWQDANQLVKSNGAMAEAYNTLSVASRDRPDDVRTQRLAALAMQHIASIAWQASDTGLSLKRSQAALDAYEQLAAMHPDDSSVQSGLADSHQSMAGYLHNLYRAEEAMVHRMAAHEIFARLVAEHPDDMGYKSRLASSFSSLFTTSLMLKHNDEAQRYAEAALALNQEIAANDPDSFASRLNVAMGFRDLGTAALALGDMDMARRNFEIELEGMKQWAANDPDSLQAKRAVMQGYSNLGRATGEARYWRAALAELEKIKAAGLLPDYDRLYEEEVRAEVAKRAGEP